MNRPVPRGTVIALGVAVHIGAVAAVSAASGSPSEASFLGENQVVMDRMRAGMNVRPSGDVDRHFAAMMIPHHQGAIDMALAELRYGRNEQLRRLALGIIVEQEQEIGAMQLALGQPLPLSGAAPLPPPDVQVP